jgi:hypothetical protein
MLAEAASTHHARTGQSGGNGSLTRTAPVAFAFLRDRDGLAAAARAVPALTQSRILRSCLGRQLASTVPASRPVLADQRFCR